MSSEYIDNLVYEAERELFEIYKKHDEIEYINSNKVIEAFRENKIYFNTASNFNDPYDYAIASVDGKAQIQGYVTPRNADEVNSLLHDVHNGEVSCCPAGGTYYLKVIKRPSGIPEIDIFCDCEAHNPDGRVPDTVG